MAAAVLVCSFRRLHIAPFTPDLSDRIIPPSVQPSVKDISFHTVQTFPEKGFGFVELPAMEAEKLRKKFQGTTLRGQKVRVEEAKPDPKVERERKRKSEDEREEEGKVRKKSKKGREEGVVAGVELEDGRRVKRGWVGDGEVKAGKTKRKHSGSLGSEAQGEGKKLRFKTIVPPNVAPVDDGKVKKKKGKEEKSEKKKVMVDEFANSKKASVVSAEDEGADHGSLRYEDGKGWVDQNGNVVEAERPSKRPSRKKTNKEPERVAGALESTETRDTPQEDSIAVDDAPADSDKPIDEENTAGAEDAPPEKEVHPLEALFKRPTSSGSNSAKPRPSAIDTSFSFFDQTTAEEEDVDPGVAAPKTPNTKRDLEWRSIRSAAPTPDTAAIGRKFSFPFAGDHEEEDESDESDGAEMADGEQAESGPSKASDQGQGEESAFRKWFYEHRGEFNRGWKKRRREEKKQKRQRENRRLSRRVA